jgi:two-component system cell cycle response regulator CtrA
LKIVGAFVCKLHKKLSDAMDGDNYVHTVWGHGYVLRYPMEEVEAPAP